MPTFQHPTKYRFYIQKFPQGNTQFPIVDIEEQFKCRYMKMVGSGYTDAKNTYSEDFAEKSGSNIWLPNPEDLAYKSSEISLYLRWRSDECGDVQEWSDKFFQYVTGQRLEWHDSFRSNRYWHLVLEKAPSVETEILNRKPNYLIVKYTFNNFGGKFYNQSQL